MGRLLKRSNWKNLFNQIIPKAFSPKNDNNIVKCIIGLLIRWCFIMPSGYSWMQTIQVDDW
jgi:hypothetical protein